MWVDKVGSHGRAHHDEKTTKIVVACSARCRRTVAASPNRHRLVASRHHRRLVVLDLFVGAAAIVLDAVYALALALGLTLVLALVLVVGVIVVQRSH